MSLHRMRWVRALAPALVASLAAPTAGGCARSAVTGRPEMVLVSQKKEVELGRAEAAKVEESLGLVKDPALERYLQAVGSRLAAVMPKSAAQWRFGVVDRPEPNAFALPGGPVYVSRGLLALLESEDELAGVLGHEMGHVLARHAVRRLTVGAPFALVFGIPAQIVGIVSEPLGGLVALPGRLIAPLVLAPYSRSQEYEADALGVEYAAKAGWQPEALASALQALQREDALQNGESQRPDFLASHPSAPDRIERILTDASKQPVASRRPIAPDQAAFFAKLDGLLVGDDPRDGTFLGSDYLHPQLGFAITFPETWMAQDQQTVVVATPENAKGRAFVMLQVSGKGTDPAAGAREDGLDPKLLARGRALAIHGLPALRLSGVQRKSAYEFTWIALGGNVYRVSAVCPESEQVLYQPIFRATEESFRPLSRRELGRVREQRLRIVRAEAGESLLGLLKRTGSAWAPAQAAVANRIEDPGAPLRAGRLVKVARSEPYVARD